MTHSVITSGTYRGVDSDVATLETPLVIIVNKNASEDIVYYAAKPFMNISMN